MSGELGNDGRVAAWRAAREQGNDDAGTVRRQSRTADRRDDDESGCSSRAERQFQVDASALRAPIARRPWADAVARGERTVDDAWAIGLKESQRILVAAMNEAKRLRSQREELASPTSGKARPKDRRVGPTEPGGDRTLPDSGANRAVESDARALSEWADQLIRRVEAEATQHVGRASEAARELVTEASALADAMIGDARRQRDILLREANELADSWLAEVVEERTRLQLIDREESASLRAAARAEADQMVRSAQAEWIRIVDDAAQKARQALDAAERRAAHQARAASDEAELRVREATERAASLVEEAQDVAARLHTAVSREMAGELRSGSASPWRDDDRFKDPSAGCVHGPVETNGTPPLAEPGMQGKVEDPVQRPGVQGVDDRRARLAQPPDDRHVQPPVEEFSPPFRWVREPPLSLSDIERLSQSRNDIDPDWGAGRD